MERAGTRQTDRIFRSRYLLTLLAIVTILTSGCSSQESTSNEQEKSSLRTHPRRSVQIPSGVSQQPARLERLRLPAYHLDPLPPPVVAEAEIRSAIRAESSGNAQLPSEPDPEVASQKSSNIERTDRPPLLDFQSIELPISTDDFPVFEQPVRLPLIMEPPVLEAVQTTVAPRYSPPNQAVGSSTVEQLHSPTVEQLHELPTDEIVKLLPSVGALPSCEMAREPTLPSTEVVRDAPGMEAVARRADMYVKKGFELAGRGALYSARRQFIRALQTIADALDAHSATSFHTTALDSGLTALQESDDFRSSDAVINRQRLETIVASHRTPILRSLTTNDSTHDGPSAQTPGRVVAMQRYYTYAQQQLTAAGGHETVASLALYGLGKTSLALQQSRDPGVIAGGPKAIVLHQAAMLVDSRNYMAANEIGVLMAHCGQYDAARRALQHAAANSQNTAVWKNLAMVHEVLGETDLAHRARHQVEIVFSDREKNRQPGSDDPSGSPQQPIVWMNSSEFATTSKFEADTGTVGSPHPETKSLPRPNPPQEAARRAPSKWFPSFGGTRK